MKSKQYFNHSNLEVNLNYKRHKISTFLFICLYIFSYVGSSTAQLQDASYEEPTRSDTIQEKVTEQPQQTYVRERETIIRQLEIITGDEETRYRIVPGDTLSISHMDRGEKVEAVYQLPANGLITLPLIGSVNIIGLNRKQAREKIEIAFKEFIRYPKVDIKINQDGRYMVAGEVDEPGVFRLRANLTVMEAILAANFERTEVNLKSVVVMRGSPDNPVAKRLNLHKMITEGDRSDNIVVKPGDFIYVPKRFIANVEGFISTVYRYVSAYYGLGRIPGEPADTGAEADKVFFD